MDYITFEIFSDIVLGYTLSTLAFLLISKFNSRFSSFKFQYLDAANRILLGLSVIFYIFYWIYLLKNINSIEKDLSFNSYRINSAGWTTIATLLIPSLFLYGKFRQNFFIMLLVMVSLLIFTNHEKAIIIITNFYRDYLPSSWSVEYGSESYLTIGLASIIYFALVVLVIRLRKTNA